MKRKKKKKDLLDTGRIRTRSARRHGQHTSITPMLCVCVHAQFKKPVNRVNGIAGGEGNNGTANAYTRGRTKILYSPLTYKIRY